MEPKQVDFCVIKQKIIKTDEVLQMYLENNNKLKKTIHVIKELKCKYDRSQLENERCTFTLKNLKSKHEQLESQCEELINQQASLEQKYSQNLIESHSHIQTLENELQMLKELTTASESITKKSSTTELASQKLEELEQQLAAYKETESELKKEYSNLTKENMNLKVQLDKKDEDNRKALNLMEKENAKVLQNLHFEMDNKIKLHGQLCHQKNNEIRELKLSLSNSHLLKNRITFLEAENEKLRKANLTKDQSLIEAKRKKKNIRKSKTVSVQTEEIFIQKTKEEICSETDMTDIFRYYYTPILLSPLRSPSPANLIENIPNITLTDIPDIIVTPSPPLTEILNSFSENSNNSLDVTQSNIDEEHVIKSITDDKLSNVSCENEFKKLPTVSVNKIKNRNLKRMVLLKNRKTMKKRPILKKKLKIKTQDSILRALQILNKSKINFTISNESPSPIRCNSLKECSRIQPSNPAHQINLIPKVESLACNSQNCNEMYMLINASNGLLGFFNQKKENLTPSPSRIDTRFDSEQQNPLTWLQNKLKDEITPENVLDKLAELVFEKIKNTTNRPNSFRGDSSGYLSETEGELEHLFEKPTNDIFAVNALLMKKLREGCLIRENKTHMGSEVSSEISSLPSYLNDLSQTSSIAGSASKLYHSENDLISPNCSSRADSNHSCLTRENKINMGSEVSSEISLPSCLNDHSQTSSVAESPCKLYHSENDLMSTNCPSRAESNHLNSECNAVLPVCNSDTTTPICKLEDHPYCLEEKPDYFNTPVEDVSLIDCSGQEVTEKGGKNGCVINNTINISINSCDNTSVEDVSLICKLEDSPHFLEEMSDEFNTSKDVSLTCKLEDHPYCLEEKPDYFNTPVEDGSGQDGAENDVKDCCAINNTIDVHMNSCDNPSVEDVSLICKLEDTPHFLEEKSDHFNTSIEDVSLIQWPDSLTKQEEDIAEFCAIDNETCMKLSNTSLEKNISINNCQSTYPPFSSNNCLQLKIEKDDFPEVKIEADSTNEKKIKILNVEIYKNFIKQAYKPELQDNISEGVKDEHIDKESISLTNTNIYEDINDDKVLNLDSIKNDLKPAEPIKSEEKTGLCAEMGNNSFLDNSKDLSNIKDGYDNSRCINKQAVNYPNSGSNKTLKYNCSPVFADHRSPPPFPTPNRNSVEENYLCPSGIRISTPPSLVSPLHENTTISKDHKKLNSKKPIDSNKNNKSKIPSLLSPSNENSNISKDRKKNNFKKPIESNKTQVKTPSLSPLSECSTISKGHNTKITETACENNNTESGVIKFLINNKFKALWSDRIENDSSEKWVKPITDPGKIVSSRYITSNIENRINSPQKERSSICEEESIAIAVSPNADNCINSLLRDENIMTEEIDSFLNIFQSNKSFSELKQSFANSTFDSKIPRGLLFSKLENSSLNKTVVGGTIAKYPLSPEPISKEAREVNYMPKIIPLERVEENNSSSTKSPIPKASEDKQTVNVTQQIIKFLKEEEGSHRNMNSSLDISKETPKKRTRIKHLFHSKVSDSDESGSEFKNLPEKSNEEIIDSKTTNKRKLIKNRRLISETSYHPSNSGVLDTECVRKSGRKRKASKRLSKIYISDSDNLDEILFSDEFTSKTMEQVVRAGNEEKINCCSKNQMECNPNQAVPVKRGRGRPRKYPKESETKIVASIQEPDTFKQLTDSGCSKKLNEREDIENVTLSLGVGGSKKSEEVLSKPRKPIKKITKLQSKIMKQMKEKQKMLQMQPVGNVLEDSIKGCDVRIKENMIETKSLNQISNNVTNLSREISILQNREFNKPTDFKDHDKGPISVTGLNVQSDPGTVYLNPKNVELNINNPKKNAKKNKTKNDILSQILKDMDRVKPQIKRTVIKREVPEGIDEKQWRKNVLDIAEIVHDKRNIDMKDIYGPQPYKKKRTGILINGSKVPAKITVLIKKLLAIPNEDDVPESIMLEFKRLTINEIVDIVLYQVSRDVNDKPDRKYDPAPLMTRTQRIFLGLLVRLEKQNGFENILEHFFFKTQEYMFKTGCTVQAAIPLTRLFLSLCRLHANINRMRTFCCEAFFHAEDLAIPIFFTVLTSWIDVMPLEVDIKTYPLAKVLFQLVHLKTCKKPGYNLFPLKCLLTQYHGYGTERWVCDTIFEELSQEYLSNPCMASDYAIRLFCKNKDTKFVYKKLNEFFKPLIYKIPAEEVNFKSATIMLMGKICRQFKVKNEHDWKCLVELKRWFEGLLEDNPADPIKQSINTSIEHLPCKKKRPMNNYFVVKTSNAHSCANQKLLIVNN